MQIGLKLHILRFEDGFRAALGFGAEFTAEQQGARLIEVGFATGQLRRQALVVRDRRLQLLLRRRMSLIQPLLALAFRVGTNQVRSYCFSTSFGRGDLRLCLIDTGERFRYKRVLQLALPTVVFDGSTGSLNCCAGLVNLCPVIVVLQFDDDLALVYSLKVGYMNRA